MAHDDNLPVVKFENTDPNADKNLRTVRPHHQSPIDSTKAGIVNLASKTTGASTGATGNYSTIGGGNQNTASGDGATVPGGVGNTASGANALAEGGGTTAGGANSHAEGTSSNPGVLGLASGANSHVEGNDCIASGTSAHAEGGTTTASGNRSHSEGADTTAGGSGSHAEGISSSAGVTGVASGIASHVEGSDCNASALAAHAQGLGSAAIRPGQHADTAFNTPVTTPGKYQHGTLTLGSANVPPSGVGTTELFDNLGNPFTLENSKTYGLKIRLVVALQEGVGGLAQVVRDALVSVDSLGNATINFNNLTLNQQGGALFDLILTVTSGPPVLHVAVFNNGGIQNAVATLDWTEAPNTIAG